METNTQRLLHTFTALADLGQEIADNADFEEMLRASFHLLLGSLAIRRGAVAEYDREGGQLRIVAMRGISESGQTELPLAHDHARQLASRCSALSFHDATREAERRRDHHKEFFGSVGMGLLLPPVVRVPLIGRALVGERDSGA